METVVPSFAYGTFEQRSNDGGEQLWSGNNHGHTQSNNPYNNNVNSNTSALLSPSYSRRSAMTNTFAGSRAKRGSLASQPDLLENHTVTNFHNDEFAAISKYTVAYLTFTCCVLLADMAQMIVLYTVLPDSDAKKYILIYILFPFVTFLFLKIYDLLMCNQILYLYDSGYHGTPTLLDRNRQFIHFLTFIVFPMCWIFYLLMHSDWIQSQHWYQRINREHVNEHTLHSILVSVWTIMQFIQFLLCLISLLYCIQHNIHQQSPNKIEKRTRADNGKYSFSFSITNTYNKASQREKINGYLQRIQTMDRQISSLQTELIKCKQESFAATSQISIDMKEELEERDQEFRALMSEKDLLKTECENKKSLLNMKKQQIKQQQASIKNLQQIREENLTTIGQLKKKLAMSRKEVQKMHIMLQIEKQNVQKAQEYFENFA